MEDTKSGDADLRALRQAAGLSQLRVAAATETSLSTVRLFEANPNAVGRAKRRALRSFYDALVGTSDGDRQGG